VPNAEYSPQHLLLPVGKSGEDKDRRQPSGPDRIGCPGIPQIRIPAHNPPDEDRGVSRKPQAHLAHYAGKFPLGGCQEALGSHHRLNHPYPIYPNLTKEQPPAAINQLWVSDITYIRIESGFVYLAVILDAFSRRVIGYCVSRGLDAQITLKALDMAICRRNPAPGVIHHSDRGVQYASGDYTNRLKSCGFHISMSRKGNPYDNATAESFFKTLKAEEVYLWEYRNLADVRERIPYFLEAVYNRKRLHSSLGYLPPEEFEKRLLFKEQKNSPARPGYSNLSVQG